MKIIWKFSIRLSSDQLIVQKCDKPLQVHSFNPRESRFSEYKQNGTGQYSKEEADYSKEYVY